MTNIVEEGVFATSSEIIGTSRFLRLGDDELTSLVSLFSEYERARSAAQKQAIAEKIQLGLVSYIELEEEITYPLHSKLALSHNLFRYLLAELASLDPQSLIYDIKIRVLGDHVKHYIKQKQNMPFPEANASFTGAMTTGKEACAA